MKLVLFAAALMLSGAAIAQETTETTTTDTTVTTTTTMPSTGMTVAPSNANPERDARGIPVISDAAVAPPGVNTGNTIVPPGAVAVPNQGAAFQTTTATTSYPACSRSVTDHCVQTYERRKPN